MRRAVLLAVVLVPAAGPVRAADAEHGASLFEQCQACHTLTVENGVGPTLKGVIGRHAGAIAGFRYSPAMRRANVVWDAATLDRFLADPQAVVRGNRMPFAGVTEAGDRQDIIAFLAKEGS
ncbi:cytochrome c [Humitalea rosea]|uniref:Cytochrome c n=1 Tax=Humitalea rosea TaxID=990373 RepID=A0A2W7IDW6_9PROT|nr:cytochrome c family protein [Humitalea rosea]PZW44921.1 cytochrome c [Humitalea rosea]